MCIFGDIYRKRDLLKELVLKDLRLRYRSPVLGALWMFLSPFLMVGIFYFVFSAILKVKISESPFVLYLMSGVFSWRLFQDTLTQSVTSLVDNKNLIREANFGHMLLPLSILLSNLIYYLPPLTILVLFSLLTLKALPVFIVLLPLVILLQCLFTLGLAMMASVLYVKWRDTKYITEVILTAAFYLTPVFYSLALIKEAFPEWVFTVYTLNPCVGILNLYRCAILNGFYPQIKAYISFSGLFIIPVFFSALTLFLGLYFYKLNKDKINDHLNY